jgi:outer membrane receptor protein involved in Fe transport
MEGRVILKATGAPVANAEISIVGMPGTVKTGADGRFSWAPDPAPPFQVLVILPGGRIAKPILIERIDPATILTIQIESILTENVTVSGAAPSIDATPAAGMTLVSGSEIISRSPANVLQALENVPGVSQASEGQAAVPAVRGLAQGRTLILIDSARVTSERRVGPSATFLDPSVIESIDVARGPGSVAYGSDAFGGVISVRTRRPEPNAPWAGRASGTLGAGIPDRRGSVEISKGFSRGGVLVQAHARDVEDYRGPDFTVLNSGYRDSGFLIRADAHLGGGMLSTGWQSDFARDVERPRNNSQVTRFYNPFENSHRFTIGYDTVNVAGLSELKITGFLGSSDQRTDQDTFGTATRARSIVRADIAAKDFGVRAIAERRVGRTALEFGADINGRYGLEAHDILVAFDLSGAETSVSDTISTADARKVDTGLFGQVRTTIAPTVQVAGGLRGDLVRNTNVGGFFGDRSESTAAASGFGAVTVGPYEGVSFTAQVSRGYRDPRLSDLYFRGPTGRGFITGNPDLEPERSVQADVGVRFTSGRVTLAGYVYRYEITNLIERFQTDPDFFFFRNRGRARLTGFEIEAQASLAAGVSLEIAAQTMNGEAIDDGARLDDLPPDSISIMVRKPIRDRGSLFLRLAAYARHGEPGPNEIPAPGHTAVDAGGSWRLTDRLELRGQARNLLNQEYFASPVSRFVFAPGRSASVTIAVGF